MSLILLWSALAAIAAGPFTDYRGQRPGLRHRITVQDLPLPYQSEDAVNGPELVPRPQGAWPRAPAGFRVELYAEGLDGPRLLRAAPNGDLFVAESRAGRVRVLRGRDQAGRPQRSAVFAFGLDRPFGLAFYPPGGEPEFLYVAETDRVVRFPYGSGELTARAQPEPVLELPGGGLLRGGGHWTRDVVFSRDGETMWVSVGSRSNVSDDESERHRACVLEASPRGEGLKIYAWGLRNPVGLAVHPDSGELWVSVNERDGLGDHLPPDYITHVEPGGFYGWPWYYMGAHQDPRHAGKRPELRDAVLVPDVLLEPHNASLQLAFYDGRRFPVSYRGDLFAAQHGSWNRANRTGYEVIRVRMQGGRATGEYEDFLTGFVTPEGRVWGRPVGVAVAPDGALWVSDDGSGSIWRVSHGAPATATSTR